MTTTTIPVPGVEPYDVLVGRGILDSIATALGASVKKVLVVHPAALGAKADALRKQLKAKYPNYQRPS